MGCPGEARSGAARVVLFGSLLFGRRGGEMSPFTSLLALAFGAAFVRWFLCCDFEVEACVVSV
eukprot:9906408-Lingulodinium_polyedra.AAC.1